jgi:hypothetical protein
MGIYNDSLHTKQVSNKERVPYTLIDIESCKEWSSWGKQATQIFQSRGL